jgi:hypothetical protein
LELLCYRIQCRLLVLKELSLLLQHLLLLLNLLLLLLPVYWRRDSRISQQFHQIGQ